MDNRARFLAGEVFYRRPDSKVAFRFITFEALNPEEGGYIERKDPHSFNPSEVVCNVHKILDTCFEYFVTPFFESHHGKVEFHKLIFKKGRSGE